VGKTIHKRLKVRVKTFQVKTVGKAGWTRQIKKKTKETIKEGKKLIH
jgi:hypothetical protein